MKQRLGIAVALLSSPDLLILDEPTNGLDPSGIQEIRELIKELPKSGMSVIVSSHLLSEIDQMATQVGIINNGKMIFQDSIASLHQKRKPLLKVGVSDVIEAKTILNRKGLKVDLQKNDLWHGSKPFVGSSRINKSGLLNRATAIPKRCFIPREYSLVSRFATLDNLTVSNTSLVESPTYYGNLTGYENLEAVRRLRGLPEQRVNEVLETVRLSKVANRLTKEYSLGMHSKGILLSQSICYFR